VDTVRAAAAAAAPDPGLSVVRVPAMAEGAETGRPGGSRSGPFGSNRGMENKRNQIGEIFRRFENRRWISGEEMGRRGALFPPPPPLSVFFTDPGVQPQVTRGETQGPGKPGNRGDMGRWTLAGISDARGGHKGRWL